MPLSLIGTLYGNQGLRPCRFAALCLRIRQPPQPSGALSSSATRRTLGISGGARRRPLHAVVSPRFGRSRRRWPPSLAFQSISPSNYLEFAADGFLDRNDGSRLEYESRKHRTELVNGHRIVAFHQHVPAPPAASHQEALDLKIARRVPLPAYI